METVRLSAAGEVDGDVKIKSHKIEMGGPACIRVRDKDKRMVLEIQVCSGFIFVSEGRNESAPVDVRAPTEADPLEDGANQTGCKNCRPS